MDIYSHTYQLVKTTKPTGEINSLILKKAGMHELDDDEIADVISINSDSDASSESSSDESGHLSHPASRPTSQLHMSSQKPLIARAVKVDQGLPLGQKPDSRPNKKMENRS
ncbi:hypothetical protein QCA50_010958 [Cerrena zonata]|uniref:Uncharacterized protein n=1 Tax=Cerrena zonata TaxID=2478898 RepID=A0AAW0G956_9APHY